MARIIIEEIKCTNCGAMLQPNPLASSIKCGYCDTVHQLETVKTRTQSELSPLPSSEQVKVRMFQKGSFIRFLWTVIFVYLGVVVLGWLVSKIPGSGISFLLLLFMAALIITLGRYWDMGPGFIIRASRWVFQRLEVCTTYFLLLLCVGVAALVWSSGYGVEQTKKPKKVEIGTKELTDEK